ncbi:MAG: methylated-DNA--[protein]-cysteine S-methyltransferase [Proteobacteria bacterium]|nr:methylated-DNA--[protein]-cysteine S-methyltransferase [Pseudomonadota bacterium]
MQARGHPTPPGDPPLVYRELPSPVGPLRLVGAPDGTLWQLGFVAGRHPRPPASGWREDRRAFADVVAQLAEYFAGARREFDLRLEMRGSPFQCAVWSALRAIPYGSTTSYAEVAARVGRPAASRAVGAANGANPVAIIVPCHRVVGANGTLTGFGGGLPAKQFLLDLERAAGGQQRLI